MDPDRPVVPPVDVLLGAGQVGGRRRPGGSAPGLPVHVRRLVFEVGPVRDQLLESGVVSRSLRVFGPVLLVEVNLESPPDVFHGPLRLPGPEEPVDAVE